MDTIKLGSIELVYRAETAQPRSVQAVQGHSAAKVQSVSEAEQQVGWTIYRPSYLPFANMQLKGVYVHSSADVPDYAVSKYTTDSGFWMTLGQQLVPPCDGCRRYPISSSLRLASVNSGPAAIYEHSVSAAGRPGGQLDLVCCSWERGGYFFELEAPLLSDQVVIKIAESVDW